MAHLCRMGWTQYLELSGLKRSIDWVSQCSSRGRGQQLLLPAVFINITCGPPAATDHNSSFRELCKGTNRTANVKREFDGPSRQSGTESIVYRRHSPMEIGKACRVGPVDKPGRGTMRVAQPVGPTKCPINSQFSHSEHVSDGIGDVTSYFQFGMECSSLSK